MTESLKKLLEMVSKDETLSAKVGAMGKEELLALAKELGIELTEADLAKLAVQELNDDDLDTVAGGAVDETQWFLSESRHAAFCPNCDKFQWQKRYRNRMNRSLVLYVCLTCGWMYEVS